MKKSFWKKVLWIGLPVALQNLINTILNLCDTLMISSLGENFISSVGLANKVFFVFNLLLFGIVSGCSIMASQFYGKGDSKGLSKIFGFSLLLSLIGGLLFFIPSVIMPKQIINIFTKSESFIEIGGAYLRIVAVSYVFTSVSMAITGLLKSVNRTRVPMLVTLGCVAVNIFFNYIFIFGKFGAPRLEANGAAIGTIISRFIEMIILICYLIFSEKDFRLKIKEMFRFESKFCKYAIVLAAPVIINEFAWGLGTTIYSVIYGHMSDDVVTAMTIATLLQDLVYAFLLGISNATAIIIGNELGAKEFDKSKVTARKLLRANFIFGFILSGVLLSTMYAYTSIYQEVTPTVLKYVIQVSIVYACFLPFKAFNLTNICGVLRSGGDTIFCMLLDLIGVWCVAIPLGCLGAFGLNLGIGFVFAFILSEEVLKLIVGFIRYRKQKWIRDITVSNEKNSLAIVQD